MALQEFSLHLVILLKLHFIVVWLKRRVKSSSLRRTLSKNAHPNWCHTAACTGSGHGTGTRKDSVDVWLQPLWEVVMGRLLSTKLKHRNTCRLVSTAVSTCVGCSITIRLVNQHWLQTDYKLQGTTTAQAAATVSDKGALQQRLPRDAQSSGLCLPSAAMAVCITVPNTRNS